MISTVFRWQVFWLLGFKHGNCLDRLRYLFHDGGRSALHGQFHNSFKAIGGLKWKSLNCVHTEVSCCAGMFYLYFYFFIYLFIYLFILNIFIYFIFYLFTYFFKKWSQHVIKRLIFIQQAINDYSIHPGQSVPQSIQLRLPESSHGSGHYRCCYVTCCNLTDFKSRFWAPMKLII